MHAAGVYECLAAPPEEESTTPYTVHACPERSLLLSGEALNPNQTSGEETQP